MVIKTRGQEEKEGSEQYTLENTLLFGGLESSLEEVTFILNWKNHRLQQKQDWELTMAQIMTTRPFRYDLNQIPDDYTVEVRNRFNGLYLIERVPDKSMDVGS